MATGRLRRRRLGCPALPHPLLILPDRRVARFMSKLQCDEVASGARWQPITLSQLHDTLACPTGLTPADDDPAAQLMLALARLAS